MCRKVKNWIPYTEQLERIRSKNIIINDAELVYESLESISYYTLINGYKHSFLQPNEYDLFISGTRFEDLYTLHMIDIGLSSILLKYALLIERSLKTKISYLFGEKYGSNVSDYLKPENFNRRNHRNTKDLLNRIKLCCDKSKDTSYLHYLKEYGSEQIPPWIVINTLSFNMLKWWYDRLKSEDKNYVCDRILKHYTETITLLERKELLDKCLTSLAEFRNSIAHGKRIFENSRIELHKESLLQILDEEILTEAEFDYGVGRKGIFAIMLSIVLLLNDSYILANYLQDLSLFFEQYQDVFFVNNMTFTEALQLPENTIERLQIFVERKIQKTVSQI